MKHRNFVPGATLLAAVVSLSSPGFAADETPKGLMKDASATAAKEDVATSGFEAQTKPTDDKDVTELKLSAGGLAAGGNSRSLAASGAGKFRVREASNQFTLVAAGNYGRSAASAADSVETTVENVQGKSRYDRFLSGSFAVFGAISALKDRFQGLDLRLNVDPGIAYYFVDEAKQQLWGELGYDFQYDVRRKENLDEAAATGEVLEKTQVRHNARAFAGYTNNLSKTATLDTGLEYVQAVSATENFRLNWNVALTSAIAGNFSIAAAFNLKFDNNPLPGVKDTDYLTSLSLVYQLL